MAGREMGGSSTSFHLGGDLCAFTGLPTHSFMCLAQFFVLAYLILDVTTLQCTAVVASLYGSRLWQRQLLSRKVLRVWSHRWSYAVYRYRYTACRLCLSTSQLRFNLLSHTKPKGLSSCFSLSEPCVRTYRVCRWKKRATMSRTHYDLVDFQQASISFLFKLDVFGIK